MVDELLVLHQVQYYKFIWNYYETKEVEKEMEETKTRKERKGLYQYEMVETIK